MPKVIGPTHPFADTLCHKSTYPLRHQRWLLPAENWRNKLTAGKSKTLQPRATHIVPTGQHKLPMYAIRADKAP